MKKQNGNAGAGVLGLLGLLFVALKLLGYITWSWWWVTLPFWGGTVLILVLSIFIVYGLTKGN